MCGQLTVVHLEHVWLNALNTAHIKAIAEILADVLSGRPRILVTWLPKQTFYLIIVRIFHPHAPTKGE
jgi:hypothetical protein